VCLRRGTAHGVYRVGVDPGTTYRGYVNIVVTPIRVTLRRGAHVTTRTRRQRPGIAPAASDAELIDGMRTGDGDALEALFGRYARLVRRVALDILRDRGEAEDVTQEVFLEIHHKAHLYDASRGSVRVWLLQYAYHRTLRRKAALRLRAAYGGEPLDEAEACAEEERRQLTQEECRWVIRAGLARLPDRQRATLELACFEELSLRDVAARLGVSVGCTRHYYYRGLARLQAWARLAGAVPTEAHVASEVRDLGSERAVRAASAADRAGVGTPRGRRPCGRVDNRSARARR
jgi:RNA polymerase sigma-70 factor (ECF subfamily)